MIKSLVNSKTGSEYLGSEEVQINKQNWSKKLYSMILEEGIPNNLHFDQELLTSVVVNLFSYCLENMSKSFVYINIDYCFKAQTLSIVIDEKGVAKSKKKVSKVNLSRLVES